MLVRTKDAVAFFGTQEKLGQAFSAIDKPISQEAVSQWGEFLPPLRSMQFEVITKGEIKFAQDSSSENEAA